MDTNILFISILISGIGLTTIIGFVANLWLKSITHEKDIHRLEKKIEKVEEIENQNSNEQKKKIELIMISIAKLDSLPNDFKELRKELKEYFSKKQ